MRANFILCSAFAALLLPTVIRAQQPETPPDRPVRPDREQLREELRNLPPEERRERMRAWWGQNAPQQGAAAARPFANQPRMQFPGMAAGAAGGVGRVIMVLTPEQRESLREASEADREKVRDLQEQLNAARKAAAEAGIAAEFNESALREKLEAAARLDTELTIIRARALSRIEPPLSEEQIERLKNPPPIGAAFRDGPPGRIQEPPPGGSPRRGELPPPDRPGRRPLPRDGQFPPPEPF